MRKRKREDWLQLVYKYRAYMNDIPNFIWEHVSTQRETWNALCTLLDDHLEEWSNIKEEVTDEEKDAFWNAFWSECQGVVEASPLNWEASDDIFDRFQTSTREFFKNPDHGKPHRRSPFTKQIRCVHRYTGGGKEVEKLFGSRAWRFSILEAPPEEAYQDSTQDNRRQRVVPARFGIERQTLNFQLRLHRPFPEKAIIKRMALLGKWQPKPWNGEYWIWHVAIWLEVPSDTFAVSHDGVIAGLDLGWRKFDEYLRIGYIRDSQGRNIELRLPLDMPNHQTRRNGLPSSWDDKREMDAQIAYQVDAVKTKIKPILDNVELPSNLQRSVAQMQKMRQGGLRQLYVNVGALHSTEYWCGDLEHVTELLKTWADADEVLRYRVNKLSGRLTRRKEWLYGNLAAWLMKTYHTIVWEGDLGVKQMAENDDEEEALKRANRYRQIAAIGKLRKMIRTAAEKYGCELVDGETAGTTSTCSICDGEIEVGSALQLQCENGHLMDQDENAARNLLSQISGGFVLSEGLRDSTKLDIPQELKRIVVP